MEKKRALGKGLSALIPEESVKLESGVVYLDVNLIQPNPFQPRVEFNKEKQEELIASIKEKGFLQPILVRKVDSGYELVAGERRLRAAKSLRMQEIPAMVKEVSDSEALILSIIENIQREELNAIEEAHAFQRLVEEFNLTQEVVADSVGIDRSSVSNILRLLKLPEEIQKGIAQGTLSMGHARTLLSLENLSDQIKFYQEIISKQLSVRELESKVRATVKPLRRKTRIPTKDPYIREIEENLQHYLGTKVRIIPLLKRGKIIIDYYSLEDLKRILGLIRR